MYKSYMKNSMYLAASMKRRSYRWADIVSYPLITNVIKNNITSSVICNCMSVEDWIMNE